MLFTWKEIEIVGPPKPGVTLSGKTLRFAERVGMRDIDVSLTHSHTMAAASCVADLDDAAAPARPRRTDARAALLRGGDAGGGGALSGLPRLGGRADGARRRRRRGPRCFAHSPTRGASPSCAANGANGGDGRIAARVLREAGRDAVETDDPAGADVVIDALFGTGFHGAPRAEAAALIERINASEAPSSRSTSPPASTRRPARSPAPRSTPT